MIVFNVNDMTCGHCVSAITKAVNAIDAKATVSVDLGTKRVEIDGHSADASALESAIANAGYTPIEGAPATQSANSPGGGCCGGRH